MHKSYFYTACVLILCCFVSCKKDDKSYSVVGKWNLQHQTTQLYTDGVLSMDTSFASSPNNYARVQFNNNGTYNSISAILNSSGNLGGVNETGRDSTYGTYNVVNSALTIDNSICGLGEIPSYQNGTSIPLFTIDSRSAQITRLTNSALTIHLEYNYTLHNSPTDSKAYKNATDYYYSR